MLDDHGLRLLAEMGIDVYLPRAEAGAQGAAAPADARAAGNADTTSASQADILLLGHEGLAGKLLTDLLRAARMAGLAVAPGDAKSVGAVASARGLIVLGDRLARELGAAMPAQRQNAIDWVTAATPAELARSTPARRALWGEIKRLSRTPARNRPDA